MSGTLYVVGTPVGNLEDMVPRATQVLQSVNLVLAEDTRHSANLFKQLGISTSLQACHEHNEKKICAPLVERLLAGEDMALISDAGTPLISDPGYNLVQAAHEANIEVIPVPGACAAVLALSAAGMPTDRFSFVGFPPAKASARSKWLEEVASFEHTIVFYEAPHRILDCLSQIADQLGSTRFVVVGREITKKYESWYRGEVRLVIETIASDSNHQRGEFVVVLEGVKRQLGADESQVRKFMQILLSELPVARAASVVSKQLGVPRQDCYRVGLEMTK
jgi:16S rRNA (cytidine1402-2'-O)-methyltransferase